MSATPLWTIAGVATALGLAGTFPDTAIDFVTQDSRLVKSGCLFVALSGTPSGGFVSSFASARDGWEFAEKAEAAGAVAMIVPHRIEGVSIPQLVVQDTLIDGLWTLARGFARRQQDYKSRLACADERRLNDFDGRGYLSERRLGEFCEFTLTTALDQLDFMRELLDLDGMQRRILGYAERRTAAAELPTGAALVLREIFLRGEIPRGEAARVIGVSARTAQTVTGTLLSEGLVLSNSAKGPLRLGFPAGAAASYFPNLFPAGAE